MAKPRPPAAAKAAVKNMGLLQPIEKWLLQRIHQYKYQHIFLGNVNLKKKAGTGFHHRYQGKNPPTARVARDPKTGKELKLPPDKNGAYKSRVDVQDENGKWYKKKAWSSFFPDHWTPQEVDRAINHAFKNSKPDPMNPNKWVGVYNGMKIEGFYSGPSKGDWVSAWPVVK